MPHRSQSSSVGDNPLDPNYLPPHYREDYRLAIDALIENDIQMKGVVRPIVFDYNPKLSIMEPDNDLRNTSISTSDWLRNK